MAKIDLYKKLSDVVSKAIQEEEDERCIEILNGFHKFNKWIKDKIGQDIGFCMRCELWIPSTDHSEYIIKTIKDIHDS